MPRPDAPPLTRGVVLRGAGFAVAIMLGAVAVWLIVTSTTQKRIEIGVLAGLWGLLLGAYSMFGSRRPGSVDVFGRQDAAADPSSAVALRKSGEVERVAEAAARRAFEERLEGMLRREISATMTREVADLRAEITQLRQDLLEKVGGQLRLERIETTRLIGSDLEALQHEVRQLKVASEGTPLGDLTLAEQGRVSSVRQIVEPATVRPVSRATADVQADVRPARETQRPGQDRTAATGPTDGPAAAARDAAAAREAAAARDAAAAREAAAARDAAAAREAAVAREKAQQEQRRAAELQAAQQRDAERREAARREAERQEAAKREAAKQEAARQEAARQEAAKREAAKQEAARQEAARQEAAKREAAKQEAAKREAAKQEAARQEAAKRETAKQAAAKQEAERQEAAKQEAARQEAERQTAAKREAAKQEAARQEALKQEALRQEAAAREAEADRAAQARAAQQRAAELREAQRRETEKREAERRAADAQAEQERQAALAQREAAQREAAQREAAQREAAQREAAQRTRARHSAPGGDELSTEQTGPLRPVSVQPTSPFPAATPSAHAADPFASLPRLTPFTEFELDPIDEPAPAASTTAPSTTAPSTSAASTPPLGTPAPAADQPLYTGRRRRDAETLEAQDESDAGRHSRPAEPNGGDTGGGRRRRRYEEGDSGVDLLSTLLSREGAEH